MSFKEFKPFLVIGVFLGLLIVSAPGVAGETDAGRLARKILQESGVSGGVIVQIGCGDGALTAGAASTRGPPVSVRSQPMSCRRKP